MQKLNSDIIEKMKKIDEDNNLVLSTKIAIHPTYGEGIVVWIEKGIAEVDFNGKRMRFKKSFLTIKNSKAPASIKYNKDLGKKWNE